MLYFCAVVVEKYDPLLIYPFMLSTAVVASVAIACMISFLFMSLSLYCNEASYANEMMVSLIKMNSSASARIQLPTRAIDSLSLGVISS